MSSEKEKNNHTSSPSSSSSSSSCFCWCWCCYWKKNKENFYCESFLHILEYPLALLYFFYLLGMKSWTLVTVYTLTLSNIGHINNLTFNLNVHYSTLILLPLSFTRISFYYIEITQGKSYNLYQLKLLRVKKDLSLYFAIGKLDKGFLNFNSVPMVVN